MSRGFTIAGNIYFMAGFRISRVKNLITMNMYE
jgi:hypothetical protein